MARGGGPGGFDVNALMKQAQQMQAQMLEAQEKLKDETVEASAGGGMVKVTMGGDLTLRQYAGHGLFPMAAPTGGTLLIASWLALAVAAAWPRRA